MTDSTATTEATAKNFASAVIEKSRETPVLVDFWAAWCGPCRQIAPIVEELAGEYQAKGLRVGKLDVDSNQETTVRFAVRSIPQLLFFKDGELVDTVTGFVQRETLEEKILEHL